MIERLTSIAPPAALTTGAAQDSAAIARETIGELGHRALAWTAAVGGGRGPGAGEWAQVTGGPSAFAPDMGALSQRGDVFGLDELSRALGAQLGATPAQQGELQRSLENFTRATMVHVVGLSGAEGSRQIAGLTDALAASQAAPAEGGIDGVIARLDAATDSLSHGAGL